MGGESLGRAEKRRIKRNAEALNLIPIITVTKAEGLRYGLADFNEAREVTVAVALPVELWHKSDAEQFAWLDQHIGGKVRGYSWHHSEFPGVMQLVPYGLHQITIHNGGRSSGMWADAPRK